MQELEWLEGPAKVLDLSQRVAFTGEEVWMEAAISPTAALRSVGGIVGFAKAGAS